MSKKNVTISWSGGKDSAFALYKILLLDEYNVVGLHTVINEDSKRVGLHGVLDEMINAQATVLGLPLEYILLPASEDHNDYERVMKKFYMTCKQNGIEGVVFGDIFLEDLKQYRALLLGESKLTAIYPLWHINSSVMVNNFIDIGFKTIVCSANAKFFSADNLGKTIDKSFLLAMPDGVDPCGENGEFHSFVYDGPIFKHPISFITGAVVEKQYHYQKKNEDGTCEDLTSTFLFQALCLPHA